MQYDMSKLLKLAQSEAGQKLIALLQRSDSSTLQDAVSKASAGNYEGAKRTLSSLLSSPEAQALLEQLEERE